MSDPFVSYLANRKIEQIRLPLASYWTLERVIAILRQPFCNWVSGCESAVRSLDKKDYYDIDPPFLPIEAAFSLAVKGSLPENTVDEDSIAIFEEAQRAIAWYQFVSANHESIHYTDRARVLSFPQWEDLPPGHWWSVMNIFRRQLQQAEADLAG